MKKLLSYFLILSLILPCIPVFAVDNTPTLNVDMTKTDHDILHGSAGFLYGISNEGVPDVNTLTPLKPKVLATKGALGTEHPYGDALDVADEFFQAGGEQIQMYNSNYYGVFGVTANAYDYGNVLKTIIAPHVAQWKDSMREKYPDIDSRMVYIPINEGTPVNGVAGFNEAWKIYYDAIKASDPNSVIAGPNDAVYRGHNNMYNYLEYCKNNNCLPDVITWHELQVGCLDTMDDHFADYRSICRALGIEEKQIVINEYADYSDCGVPGRLVNWIARLEDNQVYGCLPFWHQANNLNDLTANANDGNGAWWVYKWYGDMSGKTLAVTSKNTSFDRFYGLSSIDEAKQSATVLAGGNDGNGIINLNNIDKTNVFKNDKYVNIKVEASYFTGYHGASDAPKAILEGVFPVIDGTVSVNLSNMLFSTAYRVTITKTDKTTPYIAKSGYHTLYEAEKAQHYGALITEQESSPIEKPRYFCSGRVRMGGFDQEGDGLCYNIDIPYDGLYKLSFIYGNGEGSTRNNTATHAPKNITQKLFIDSEEDTLYLPNTLFYSMEGMADKYVSLTRGKHKVKVMYSSEKGAFHDALYVSHVAGFNEDVPTYNEIFEAEEADFNKESKALTKNEIAGYSESGYVTELSLVPVEEKGGVRHVVRVPESKLYNVNFRYIAENDGAIRLFLDNTNLTFTNYLTNVEIEATDQWRNAHTTIFLRKGLNIIDYDLTVNGAVDFMTVSDAMVDLSKTYEAEDAEGTFETKVIDSITFVTPLSGDEKAHETVGKYLELTVDAPFTGLYKMQVFQSNDELCGTHSYNIKIIDRYASFMVNGDKENAKRYFFPNSFSEATFLERTIPVNLTKGENKIRIYNDDSWHVLWGGSKSEPGTNRLLNYTPNFDKFIITPAVAMAPLDDTKYTVKVSSSENGYVYTDKTTAHIGEEVNVYLVPEGGISSLTINGKDYLQTLKTDDYNIYRTSFTIQENTKIFATFTKATEGDIEVDNTTDYVTIDGESYLIKGENLYQNPSFSDNSGSDMEQWFVGSNTNGHPTDSTYQKPVIKADGTYENLIPITNSGYLTTGAVEKDGVDTFYYGYNGSDTYLVEHMASNWQSCAWNGNKSLLSFVPIKENTNYYFSFDGFTVSGKASVRFGAIDMDEGENFYIPSSYSTGDTLNFTSDKAFTCTNGDMQNVGGNWNTYSLAFNSGEGADYFLFNAYWLQMAEYLCIGNFKLYELGDSELTQVEVPSLPAKVVTRGDKLTLAESVISNGVSIGINWLDSEIVDTAVSGTYVVTGELIVPEGYCTDINYIKQRVIVTDNACEITFWSVKDNKTVLNIQCFKTLDATLIVASYDGEELKKVETFPISLTKDEMLTPTIPYKANSKAFIWSENSITPLCNAKTIN